MDIKEQTTRRIQEKVNSGEYTDADEVIERALDALDETEVSDDELRRLLSVGIEELDRGEGIPVEDVITELRSMHGKNINHSAE